MDIRSKVNVLITDLLIAKDGLLQKVEGTEKEYQDSIELAYNSMSGSELLQVLERFKESRKEALESHIFECKRKVSDLLVAIDTDLNRYADGSHTTNLQDLKALENVTLSQADFEILCKRYARQSYWNDISLIYLADKNRLKRTNTNPSQAQLDSTLTAFKQLFDRLYEAIRKGGEVSEIVTRAKLTSIEDKYR